LLELTIKILGIIFLVKIVLIDILELADATLPRIRRIVIKVIKLYVEAKELVSKPELAKRKTNRNGKSEDLTKQAHHRVG
jgi:hypothetical protein